MASASTSGNTAVGTGDDTEYERTDDFGAGDSDDEAEESNAPQRQHSSSLHELIMSMSHVCPNTQTREIVEMSQSLIAANAAAAAAAGSGAAAAAAPAAGLPVSAVAEFASDLKRVKFLVELFDPNDEQAWTCPCSVDDFTRLGDGDGGDADEFDNDCLILTLKTFVYLGGRNVLLRMWKTVNDYLLLFPPLALPALVDPSPSAAASAAGSSLSSSLSSHTGSPPQSGPLSSSVPVGASSPLFGPAAGAGGAGAGGAMSASDIRTTACQLASWVLRLLWNCSVLWTEQARVRSCRGAMMRNISTCSVDAVEMVANRKGKAKFAVYVLTVHAGINTWRMRKRFSQLSVFYNELAGALAGNNAFDATLKKLPKKTFTLHATDSAITEQRKLQFNEIFRDLTSPLNYRKLMRSPGAWAIINAFLGLNIVVTMQKAILIQCVEWAIRSHLPTRSFPRDAVGVCFEILMGKVRTTDLSIVIAGGSKPTSAGGGGGGSPSLSALNRAISSPSAGGGGGGSGGGTGGAANDWFVSSRTIVETSFLPLLFAALASTDDATAIASLESITRLLVKYGHNTTLFIQKDRSWHKWLLPMLVPVPDEIDLNANEALRVSNLVAPPPSAAPLALRTRRDGIYISTARAVQAGAVQPAGSVSPGSASLLSSSGGHSLPSPLSTSTLLMGGSPLLPEWGEAATSSSSGKPSAAPVRKHAATDLEYTIMGGGGTGAGGGSNQPSNPTVTAVGGSKRPTHGRSRSHLPAGVVSGLRPAAKAPLFAPVAVNDRSTSAPQPAAGGAAAAAGPTNRLARAVSTVIGDLNKQRRSLPPSLAAAIGNSAGFESILPIPDAATTTTTASNASAPPALVAALPASSDIITASSMTAITNRLVALSPKSAGTTTATGGGSGRTSPLALAPPSPSGRNAAFAFPASATGASTVDPSAAAPVTNLLDAKHHIPEGSSVAASALPAPAAVVSTNSSLGSSLASSLGNSVTGSRRGSSNNNMPATAEKGSLRANRPNAVQTARPPVASPPAASGAASPPLSPTTPQQHAAQQQTATTESTPPLTPYLSQAAGSRPGSLSLAPPPSGGGLLGMDGISLLQGTPPVAGAASTAPPTTSPIALSRAQTGSPIPVIGSATPPAASTALSTPRNSGGNGVLLLGHTRVPSMSEPSSTLAALASGGGAAPGGAAGSAAKAMSPSNTQPTTTPRSSGKLLERAPSTLALGGSAVAPPLLHQQSSAGATLPPHVPSPLYEELDKDAARLKVFQLTVYVLVHVHYNQFLTSKFDSAHPDSMHSLLTSSVRILGESTEWSADGIKLIKVMIDSFLSIITTATKNFRNDHKKPAWKNMFQTLSVLSTLLYYTKSNADGTAVAPSAAGAAAPASAPAISPLLLSSVGSAAAGAASIASASGGGASSGAAAAAAAAGVGSGDGTGEVLLALPLVEKIVTLLDSFRFDAYSDANYFGLDASEVTVMKKHRTKGLKYSQLFKTAVSHYRAAAAAGVALQLTGGGTGVAGVVTDVEAGAGGIRHQSQLLQMMAALALSAKQEEAKFRARRELLLTATAGSAPPPAAANATATPATSGDDSKRSLLASGGDRGRDRDSKEPLSPSTSGKQPAPVPVASAAAAAAASSASGKQPVAVMPAVAAAAKARDEQNAAKLINLMLKRPSSMIGVSPLVTNTQLHAQSQQKTNK